MENEALPTVHCVHLLAASEQKHAEAQSRLRDAQRLSPESATGIFREVAGLRMAADMLFMAATAHREQDRAFYEDMARTSEADAKRFIEASFGEC